MANKKKNSEAAPTPEQQVRATWRAALCVPRWFTVRAALVDYGLLRYGLVRPEPGTPACKGDTDHPAQRQSPALCATLRF